MTKADIINKIAISTGLPKKDVAVIEAHDLPSFKPAKCFVDKMKGE